MKRMVPVALALVTSACSTASSDVTQEAAGTSPLEGTFEYVGTFKGQSVVAGGHFAYVSSPADGSAPMTGEAGTYQIARDTATHTVTYASDSSRIGVVFKWTIESTSGDTLSYVVMSAGGEVTGRGRAVRRR